MPGNSKKVNFSKDQELPEFYTGTDSELCDFLTEEFSLDIDNEVWKAINEIDELYTVNMTDENVQDRTSLSFIFTLANNTTHKVNVSNLIIRPYARVTKIISDLLKSEIHYHQYNSRVY